VAEPASVFSLFAELAAPPTVVEPAYVPAAAAPTSLALNVIFPVRGLPLMVVLVATLLFN